MAKDLIKWATTVRTGNRRMLAKAMTLIESSRADQQEQAQKLLTHLLPAAGAPLSSVRIGLTGVPGVGKSTFIEALGLYLADLGHKVAVLAVDPSSSRTGGSIMGDKTRMPYLTVHPNAFIRPSPSAGALGGVTRRTREMMVLCEAAGYDIILVETVGVGQSETQVAAMTDLFMLLTLPNAGDELQGIKRGIMELADICVVNKADIDKKATIRAQTELRTALTLLTSHDAPWRPVVLRASALKKEGVSDIWDMVQTYVQTIDRRVKRQQQLALWFDDLLQEAVWNAFEQRCDVNKLQQLRQEVTRGRCTVVDAVRQLLDP